MLSRIWIVCRKELRIYFLSPIAYQLLLMFALIFGFIFWNQLAEFVSRGIEAQFTGQSFPMSVNEWVIRPWLADIDFIGLFFIPMITMRLFAEEKRTGTIELLATSPIRDIEVILGKWIAALILYCSLMAFSGLNLIFLFAYGNPDWKPVVIGYLGLFLQAGALLALGTFVSSLTKNQITAAAVTFDICLLLWMLSWVSGYNQAGWAQVLKDISIVTHFDSFSRGVLDLKDVIYYASVIFLGLFLTTRSMESLRWRS